MKNKKIILILLTILIIIAVIIMVSIKNKGNNKETIDNSIYWVTTDENGKKTNNSEKMEELKTFEGLTLKKEELVSYDSKTEMLINVNNTTQTDIQLIPIVITLLDKEGTELVKLKGIINPTKVGESTKIYMVSSLDYTDAYDYKIEKNTEF